jgi:hypothetical protein
MDIENYKNHLIKLFNLNTSFFDKLLKELSKKKYFNIDTIKKIKAISNLVKENNYKKIELLASEIYEEKFLSSLKVESLYKKSKYNPNYYYNRLIILKTFKKIIETIKHISEKKIGKGKKTKKIGKGKKTKKIIKLGGKNSTKRRKVKSLSNIQRVKTKISNRIKYKTYFSDDDKQKNKMFEKYFPYLNIINNCSNNGQECPICLDVMNDNHLLLKCSICNNCTHLKCMHKNYIMKNTDNFRCPLCNEDVPEEVVNLFSKKTKLSISNIDDIDADEYVHGSSDSSLPLVFVEVVLIAVFSLPIFGLTGGLIDPITTNTLIHQVVSMGVTGSIIHPIINPNRN